MFLRRKKKMKRVILLIIVSVFIVSMSVTGMGCKEEAAEEVVSTEEVGFRYGERAWERCSPC
jgi:hypothetical protein